MNSLRVVLCALPFSAALLAQEPTPPPVLPAPGAGGSDVEAVTPPVKFTEAQLDQLLGPIALYPDALIALILPASTFPTDIVLAGRHLKDNGSDLSQVEHRGWDDSVKSLMNYPEVVKWMDENLNWTKQLGEIFAAQPAEVMNTIQRLRARARAAGTLVDTPQQQVIAAEQVIRIVPAQPDVIYVPYYEPSVVFVREPVYYPRPVITFSRPCRVGSWLAYDFDWARCTIWVGDRHRRWHTHDWRRPVVPTTQVVVHASTRTWTSRPWQPTHIHYRSHNTTGAPRGNSYDNNSPRHIVSHTAYGQPRNAPRATSASSPASPTSPGIAPVAALPTTTPISPQDRATVVAAPQPQAAATVAPSYRSRSDQNNQNNNNTGTASRSPDHRRPATREPLPLATGIAPINPAPASSYATVTAPRADRSASRPAASAPRSFEAPRAAATLPSVPAIRESAPAPERATVTAAPAVTSNNASNSNASSAPAPAPAASSREAHRHGRDRRTID